MITAAEYRAMHSRGARRAQGMNGTEAAYASRLELLRLAGKIRAYQFEAVKLRLALRTFLTPDFRVVMTSGAIAFHEVKGRKGKRYYCREDAMLKLKVAADRYRDCAFFVVWPDGRGGWNSERIKSAEGVET